MGGRRAPAPPQLQAPREVPLTETFQKFLGQREQIPALADFASEVNRRFRQELETGLPGTLGTAGQVSTLVSQLLQGTIPADVQTQVQRTAAERAAAVGAPATSEFARMLEARDFGFTTMDLMQQGAAYTPGLMQLSEFLSPQQAQNYLFSTGQLRGEAVKQAQDEANVANQNAINRYNYDVANARSSGGFLGTLGGVLGGVAGFALAGPAGASLGSALGGGIGSLAGGGGFAPPAGAGAFGGLIGNAGSAIFGSGFQGLAGGLAGGAGAAGISATAFSPSGQAFTMPSSSYFQPYTQSPLNPISNFLTPSSMGSYGGIAPISVGGIRF